MKSKEFSKSAFLVSRGAFISQVLMLGFTPVLSRIYAPEHFGALSVFTGVTAIFALIFTLKYELAIVLPAEHNTAFQVMKLTILISLGLSFVFFLLLLLFVNAFSLLSDNKIYIFFLPLSTFLIGLFAALQQWFLRNKNYKLISLAQIILAATTIIINIICILLKNTHYGLIIGYIIGYICACIVLLVKLNLTKLSLKFSLLYSLASRYKEFPRFMILTALLSTLSYQLIPLLIEYFYSTAEVGFFSIANRILMLPTIVIGTAIGNVFRVETSIMHNNNQDIRPLFRKVLKKQLLIGIPIFTSVAVVAPLMLTYVLGKQWYVAGIYTRYISFMAFGFFLIQPYNNIFIIKGKHEINMISQICLICLIILTVYFGKLYLSSLTVVISILSVMIFFFLSLNIFISYRVLKP